MRVLGIDPGTVSCGYGIVDYEKSRFRSVAFGLLECSPHVPLPQRLVTLFGSLENVIQEYRPQDAAIEEAFAGKSIQSSMRISEVRGMVIVCAGKAGLSLAQYPPATIKKAVVGVGSAHKSQVQHMVQILLGLPDLPRPEDASDALAVAICHCHRSHLGAL
ncbi:MAG: crossover junction endodeoxyribonuclease RuvC [Planctomycetes bacterium]|nr:crossover junction endodeoxyribonuclease RuvC [Planctomycetota bacterium]